MARSTGVSGAGPPILSRTRSPARTGRSRNQSTKRTSQDMPQRSNGGSADQPISSAYPSGVGRLSRISGMNDALILGRGVVRESVHKFGYGHKQGAAATPIVA